MLSSIFSALHQRLARVGVPVYLSDCVPPATPFPYFTADVAVPLTPRDAGRLALTFWSANDQANAHRLFQTDLLLEQLPARGFCLDTSAGRVILRLEGSAVCLRECTAQGVRTEWTLRFIPSAQGGAA